MLSSCKSQKNEEVAMSYAITEEVATEAEDVPPNSKQSSDVSESSQESTIPIERKLIKEADLVW